jgi:hypothetical protein
MPALKRRMMRAICSSVVRADRLLIAERRTPL